MAETERQLRRELDDLRARSAEMEAETERLREAAQRAIQLARAGHCPTEDAKAALLDVCRTYLAASKGPHEFFCPGQLNVLAQSIEKCDEWIKRGWSDAGLALASDCLAEIKMLSQRVESAKAVYMAELEEYEKNLGVLASRLSAALDPFETDLGSFERSPECLDHYSSGLYKQVSGEVLQAELQIIRPVRALGDAAFAEGRLPAASDLNKRLRDMPVLNARSEAAVKAADQEMRLSDGRKKAGMSMAQLLNEMGYSVRRAEFENGDSLNSFLLNGDLDSTVSLSVTLIPLREDGIAERNGVAMSCETVFGSDDERDALRETWLSRISPHIEGMLVLSGKQGEGEKDFSPNPPQPELYAQRRVQPAPANI